jgi:hypothetical protein
MLLAHSPGQFQLTPELDVIGNDRLQLTRRPRVAIRVLAWHIVLQQMEEKKYDISIDTKMRQVLNTTRCFHFAPCSISNFVTSSHRP